ncbi:type IV pilus assembly protein PilV [Paucibacter oligotrophus]|uniref:Type IV pilus assembly protein PilV n=1 Tax=Roseateles oligotrophus TaxID=1769250 RepID=A0A840L9K5_9BURK|nr:pilus assembly protein PilV [Roseateles oligotrophus]MBB4844776.1 type IV pilus assembly protein PilV [Roseateles oligotrophus]
MNKSHGRREAGFSLINIMVAILIFSFGLLGLAGLYSRFTTASTTNQNIALLAPWSNAFWGVVQANPGSTLGTMAGTYQLASIPSAPAALRPWLTQILDPNTSRNAIADATVVIATGPDAVKGTACAVATGCTVTLTIQWTQNGSVNADSSSVTRSQTFTYQFGLD